MGTDFQRFVEANTRIQPAPLVQGLRLHGADELVPLWEATEVALGRRNVDPPYWAVTWAGGLALSLYLERHPELVRDRAVIDFACGSGLVGLVAGRLGARSVLLAEIDPLARAAATLNAALNGQSPRVAERDLLGEDELPEADVVLAGDVFYAARMSAAVLPWLRAHARAGRLVLVGDPGRAYLPPTGLEALYEVEVPTSREWESRDARLTRVQRLLPD
jgi:predicted nicotinamide N-methyase